MHSNLEVDILNLFFTLLIKLKPNIRVVLGYSETDGIYVKHEYKSNI